jgi:predicted dehydrogenase
MEKPVATSVADADAILALAREHRVMHAAGYVYAHLPIVRKPTPAGAVVLGEVLRFSAHAYISEVFGPNRDGSSSASSPEGGVVANMGSHVLFILGWMFGRIRRVMATTRLAREQRRRLRARAPLVRRGVTGMLDTSWSMPGAQMLDYGITIDGRQGTLVLGREQILLHLLRRRRPSRGLERDPRQRPARRHRVRHQPAHRGESFYRQLRVSRRRAARASFRSARSTRRPTRSG